MYALVAAPVHAQTSLGAGELAGASPAIAARESIGPSAADLLLAPADPGNPKPSPAPPANFTSGSSAPLNAGGLSSGTVALLAALAVGAAAFASRRLGDSPAPRRLELFAAAIDRPG